MERYPWEISIHALTRSATNQIGAAAPCRNDFNPRTHEECDWYARDEYYYSGRFQSTHSRGVRLKLCSFLPLTKTISIHALTRSATVILGMVGGSRKYFNPRTHEECDRQPRRLWDKRSNFNPRTHEECDQKRYDFFPV